mgnify:CR=1 FL=1
MYMIEITENKMDELIENAEKMLRYGGKVMSCLDSLQRGSGRMGERSPMPDYRDEWRRDDERYGRDERDEDRYGDGRYGERYGGGYRRRY